MDPNNNGIESSASFGKIIDLKNYDRLIDLIKDAQLKGATISDYSNADRAKKFFPPVTVTDLKNDMHLMNEEIFVFDSERNAPTLLDGSLTKGCLSKLTSASCLFNLP